MASSRYQEAGQVPARLCPSQAEHSKPDLGQTARTEPILAQAGLRQPCIAFVQCPFELSQSACTALSPA